LVLRGINGGHIQDQTLVSKEDMEPLSVRLARTIKLIRGEPTDE